jgi:hypothetical protein
MRCYICICGGWRGLNRRSLRLVNMWEMSRLRYAPLDKWVRLFGSVGCLESTQINNRNRLE